MNQLGLILLCAYLGIWGTLLLDSWRNNHGQI